jgi:hypothetical protein
LIPTTILIGVDTNGASITIIINLGIAIKYNGTNHIGSILKIDVLA